MNILVTGGSGFIGSVLVGMLRDAGHTVRILDIAPSASHADITSIGDVRDYATLDAACAGMNAVVHLAAEHADNVEPRSLYYEVNVDGARNLARACDAHAIATVIFTSSVAVYGLNAGVAVEESEPAPFNDYGISKYAAEKVLVDWQAAGSGKELVIIRPSVVFGENNRGNVYNLIAAINNKRFLMVGPGSNYKSMSYVQNIAGFVMHTLEHRKAGAAVFNYADEPDLTARQIVDTIHDALGRARPRISLPYWLGMAAGHMLDALATVSGRSFPVSAVRIRKFNANTRVSAAKARASGFAARHSLSDGLALMIRKEFGPGS